LHEPGAELFYETQVFEDFVDRELLLESTFLNLGSDPIYLDGAGAHFAVKATIVVFMFQFVERGTIFASLWSENKDRVDRRIVFDTLPCRFKAFLMVLVDLLKVVGCNSRIQPGVCRSAT
jgi:hypothetical protein